MTEFREELLIAITTPIYVVVIGAEILASYIQHKHYYSVKGVLSNIYLSALNFTLDILLRVVCLFVLNFFFQFKLVEIQNQYVVLVHISHCARFYVLLVAPHRSFCSFLLGCPHYTSFIGRV